MRYRSLLPCALALSTVWVAACGDNSTEPTQPAEPTPSGADLVVVSNSWITRANLPTRAYRLALATVTNAAGQSVVYAIGGVTDGPPGYPVTLLRKVTAYNVATNTWSNRRPLPVPLSNSNGAGVINGKIYISGGFSEIGEPPTRALYVYDPGTNTWTRKRDLPAIGGPGPGWTVGGGGVTGVIKNQLYVVTFCHTLGYSDAPGPASCVGDLTGPRLFRYNPVTDRWVSLAPPFPRAKGSDPQVSSVAGGVIGGKFYVMGGTFENSGRLSVYDPATNQWTPKTPLGLARPGVATAVLGNKLYVMGGSRWQNLVDEILDITIVYDPVTNLWTRRASLPSPRVDAAGTTVLSGGKPRIEVVGGYPAPHNNVQYIP
jgi:N-acetylneuraminic acid mutarotase